MHSMEQPKRSVDNSVVSGMSKREELHQVYTYTAKSADIDNEEDSEEDSNNNKESEKPSLKKSKVFKHDVWSLANSFWHRCRFKDLVLVILFLAYVVVVAMTMVLLEERAQAQSRFSYDKSIQDIWFDFAENLTRQLLNTSELVVFVDSDISIKFGEKVREELWRYHHGLLAIYETKDGRQLEWDFWNATIFGLSLFTTIGYKHLYPITAEGKIATMLFATFGIPLLLTIIQHLAALLHDILTYILNLVVAVCNRKWTTAMFKRNDTPKNCHSRRSVALPFAIGMVLLVSWIFMCPFTILLWEREWSYLDAFYYFFLSFTTVGLDYSMPTKHQYLYLVWLWAIIGLALLSLCFKILNATESALKSSLEHFGDLGGYKSASLAAQTDSAGIPSDWCVSTMSLASSRLIERSMGPSQLVKVGTPKLPRKRMHAYMLTEQEYEEQKRHIAPKHRRQRHFANRRYELMTDDAILLANQEEDELIVRSKDALTGMSDNYKGELNFLTKLGHFRETQSLNEMTITDSMDEKKLILATLQQRKMETRSDAQVHLALSAGGSSSTTPTSTSPGSLS